VGNPVSTTFTWTPAASDIGNHELRIEGKDQHASTSCTIRISVKPKTTNQPPDCTHAVAVFNDSQPPDGKLTPFWIQGITDPDQDSLTIHITGITQDEKINSKGDHNTCPDAAINTLESGSGAIRLERSGQGNGRVYEVSFTATDGRGASCRGTATMCIPHDRSGAPCIDNGQVYNSLEPCSAQRAITLHVSDSWEPVRTVEYFLPEPATVTVSVYDVVGRHLDTLEHAQKGAGLWEVTWKTDSIPSGIYFVQLATDLGTIGKRALVVK